MENNLSNEGTGVGRQLDPFPPKQSGHQAKQTSNDGSWNWDNTLKFFQTVGIIGTGVWALYLYSTFGRTSDELTVSNQKIAKQIQELDFAHKVQYEKLEKDLALAQSTIALEQSKLALEIGRISLTSQKRELAFNKTGRFNVEEIKFDVTKIHHSSYPFAANFSARLKNPSKESVDIEIVVMQLFLGKLERGSIKIAEVNYPGKAGVIDWKKSRTYVYVCGSCRATTEMLSLKARRIFGSSPDVEFTIGGATGPLVPDGSFVLDHEYVIQEDDQDSYVGIVFDVWAGAKSLPPTSVWESRYWRSLANDPKP